MEGRAQENPTKKNMQHTLSILALLASAQAFAPSVSQIRPAFALDVAAKVNTGHTPRPRQQSGHHSQVKVSLVPIPRVLTLVFHPVIHSLLQFSGDSAHYD